MTRPDRRVWWVSFALFGVLGALWAMSVPAVGGPDEPAHVVKAAAVVRGDWNTEVSWATGGFGMRIPRTRVQVPEGYGLLVLNEQLACWSGRRHFRAICAPDLPTRSGSTIGSTTYVGTYQPTYYLLVGWPSLVLAPDRGLLAMRLVGVVLVAALLASAATSAAASPDGQHGLVGLAGVVLAVPPAVLFLAGVVNPNAAEVAAAASLWAGLALLLGSPQADRRLVVRTAVAAAVMVSVRPLSPAFAAVIVAVVGVLAVDRTALRTLWGRRSVRWAALAVGAVWAANAAHVLATRALGSVITNSGDLSGVGAARDGVESLPGWTLDQVGLLSWMGFNELHVPRPLVVGWILVTVALVLVAAVAGPARARLALGLLAVGVVTLPVAARTANPDVSYQGRYALPLAVGLPILAGMVIDRRCRGRVGLRAWVLGVVVTGAAAVHLVAHQALMSRNLHGFPSAVFAPRNPVYWAGPGSPDALFGLAVFASLALVGLGSTFAVTAVRARSRTVPGEHS